MHAPPCCHRVVVCMYVAVVLPSCWVFLFQCLQEDYAIALFVVGLAATAVGQVVVNHLVKKVSFELG